MDDRLIDRQRIQAQADMLQRITKGGEIDVEMALQERRALADRVENKRAAYLAWMKQQGYPQEAIDQGLADMDRILVALRTEPFSQEALQIGDLGF